MKIRMFTIVQFFLISAVIGIAISYGKIYLFHLALVILALSSIVYIALYKKVKIPKTSRLHFIFYYWFLWYSLSLFWTISYLYSLRYLFYLFCGSSIVFVMVYYIKDLNTQKNVFKILAIPFILEVAISLLEALRIFRFPISPFSPYVTYFAREYKIEEISLEENVLSYILTMPTGFQWNPNNLAITMLIIFPFILLHRNRLIRWVGSFSILFIIIQSGSRGVFIAFILSICLYVFTLKFTLKRLAKSIIVLSIVLILLFFYQSLGDLVKNIEFKNIKVAEILSSFNALKDYLSENSDVGGYSIQQRKKLIRNGLEALYNSHGLGVGGGGSNKIQEDQGLHMTSMHNFWIELLVEGGITFFILFVTWYIYIIVKLYMIARNSKESDIKYYSRSLYISMTSFALGCVSASSAVYLFPMYLMFGFSIATINNYRFLKNNNLLVIGCKK